MKIREAKKKDISQLKKLFLESQKYEASLDQEIVINKQTPSRINLLIEEIFRNPDRKLFIAEDGLNNIIGYVWINYSPGMEKSGWVSEIFVTQSMRHKKVGSRLMKMAFDYFKQKEIRTVRLTSYKTNKSAFLFYKTHNFKEEPPKLINLKKSIK